MRVTKNENGDFFVEDEPMHVEGDAARQFLSEMSQREEVGDDTERRLFLDECQRIYRTSRPC